MKNETLSFLNQLGDSQQSSFISFFSPKEGVNLLRLIKKGDSSLQHVKMHFLSWSAICLGEECPICAISNRLGIERLNTSFQTLVYVVDLNMQLNTSIDSNSQFNKLIKVWSFGNRISNQFKVELMDSDNADIDLFSFEKGFPIKLTRTGKGLDTQYSLKIVKKPINVLDFDSFKKEYDELESLDIVTEKMKEDTKKQLIDNFIKMKLPYETMSGIAVILNEYGYTSPMLKVYNPSLNINVDSSNAISSPFVSEEDSNLAVPKETKETKSITDIINSLKK